MTKEELVRMLEPFMDETEIVIHDAQKMQTFEIDHSHYGVLSNGDGSLVLVRGAQKLWPALRPPTAGGNHGD